MSKRDPFAEFGGKAVTSGDPFKEFGGMAVAAASQPPAPTPAPAQTPLPQSTPFQNILGAQPSDLLERVKGVGRAVGRTGLGGLQYLQYLAGTHITPTPISLEPAPNNPNANIGETIGQAAITALPTAVTGGASLPVQAAAGALTGGLAEQAQGGTGTTGAVVGGALPAVLAVGSALKQKAAPIINNWMQIPVKEFKFGADPGMRLVNEGLVRATKKETQAAVAPVLDKVGQELDAKLAAATAQGVTIDAGQTVLDATNSATKTIGKRTDKAFQAALTNVFDDILNQFPDINKLTPERAQELKIAVGDAIKWHGAAYEGDINAALVDIYRGINQDIKAKVAGIAETQSKWGDLYLANKFLEASKLADVAGQGTGNLNPIIKKGAAAIGATGLAAAGAHRAGLLGQ